MPVKNNGPGMTGRSSMTKKSKIEPEYPQWAESKMRAIENRRLKELQKIVRESMPEILAIVAEEQKTGSDSIRHDGYSDMVRRIQNRFRIMRGNGMFAGALTTPTGGNLKNGSAACAPRWEWISMMISFSAKDTT